MSDARRAVLLLASPHAARGNSASLGHYLLSQLAAHGLETEPIAVYPALKSEASRAALLAAVDAAEIVVLTAPLYVDSLPAPVIRVLELIADHRRAAVPAGHPLFVAIVNCGFPEAYHNDIALEIYHRFADEARLRWAGGLSLGMGGPLQGKPLEQLGGMVRHVRRGLDLAAVALAAGGPVPAEAVALLARPLMPRWVYLFMGNRGWKSAARHHGTVDRLRDRPLEGEAGAAAPPG
jgi:hypothetical protein